MRAHLYLTITDNQGNVQTGVGVRILEQTTLAADGTPNADVPLAATLYSGPDPAHSTVVPNQFVCDTGVVDLWLDTPQYVKIGVTPLAGAEWFIDGILAAAPPAAASGGGGSAGGGPRGTARADCWNTVQVNDASAGSQMRPADGWDFSTIDAGDKVPTLSTSLTPLGSGQSASVQVAEAGWYSVRLYVTSAQWSPGAVPGAVDVGFTFTGMSGYYYPTWRRTPLAEVGSPKIAESFEYGPIYLPANGLITPSLVWAGTKACTGAQFTVDVTAW